MVVLVAAAGFQQVQVQHQPLEQAIRLAHHQVRATTVVQATTLAQGLGVVAVVVLLLLEGLPQIPQLLALVAPVLHRPFLELLLLMPVAGVEEVLMFREHLEQVVLAGPVVEGRGLMGLELLQMAQQIQVVAVVVMLGISAETAALASSLSNTQ